MGEWDAWLGREQVQHDLLTPALLARFRATIDSKEVGSIAPQGIHWCLCLPDVATAGLDMDGHPKRGGFLPPVQLPRRMWASSAVQFHTPIHSNSAIERRSIITAIREKQGASGQLVFVDIDHVTRADGNLAVSEQQTIVYRDSASAVAQDQGTTAKPDLGNWPWQRSITPSEPLLFRYSALTFNSHRIHYDQPYATTAEGYPGLVVQGPLTATLLLDLAARSLGPNRLHSFSFRGVIPAFAGEPIHMLGRPDGTEIALTAMTEAGRTVMLATATS